FYVEMRDAQGNPNEIWVNRLKDKLGTRKVPTAELTLSGAVATPVTGLGDGTRAITPMLNVTRTWNAVCAVSSMRRGLALARDYARRRVAFGAPLADKPLHVETLAGLQAEYEGSFALTFFAIELLGRIEAGEAGEGEQLCLRLATPIAKAVTGKQSVAVASEVLESFGGAGYIEDTGLPTLLRDAQVLPIWEGTTNVLSLDLLRAVGKAGEGLRAWHEEARARAPREGEAAALGRQGIDAIAQAGAWLQQAMNEGPRSVEAGARGLLLTLGRGMALALLAQHADWALRQGDSRPLLAARRYAIHGVVRLGHQDLDEASRLALDA
ncbi:MAG: acyl-CoA dehydrogenase, partial [Myxococcales bacterium]